MLGFKTVGNATIAAFDGKCILATDPWFGKDDDAYFGSWQLSHNIPKIEKDEILDSKYVWFSHGHPDHLNPKSSRLFFNKHIILPNHAGSRISEYFVNKKAKVTVLQTGVWMQLSKNIKIMNIPNAEQDCILLIDINGRLLVDINDSSYEFCQRFLTHIISQYKTSYLLMLSGYGDADMINFYREDGSFIEPTLAGQKIPPGFHLSRAAKALGIGNVIPFSCFHEYKRSDSVWANNYAVKNLEDFTRGLDIDLVALPAFSCVDCTDDTFVKISGITKEPSRVIECKEFGDNWDDELDKTDIKKIEQYFQSIEMLSRDFSFVKVRVGKKTHTVKLSEGSIGVIFEAPAKSLMDAINWEIFDDLLIGNFMKTTLINKDSLDFGAVSRFSDNGRVKSISEVKKYFNEYHLEYESLGRKPKKNILNINYVRKLLSSPLEFLAPFRKERLVNDNSLGRIPYEEKKEHKDYSINMLNAYDTYEVSNGDLTSDLNGLIETIETYSNIDILTLKNNELKIQAWSVDINKNVPYEYLIFNKNKLIHKQKPNGDRDDVSKNLEVARLTCALNINIYTENIQIENLILYAIYNKGKSKGVFIKPKFCEGKAKETHSSEI